MEQINVVKCYKIEMHRERDSEFQTDFYVGVKNETIWLHLTNNFTLLFARENTMQANLINKP